MGILSLCVAAMSLVCALSFEQPAVAPAGPETFTVTATVTASGRSSGGVTVPITIQIDRYTPEYARTAITDGLKYGGYPGFLKALRAAPVAGHLEAGGQKFAVRWARQQASGSGRTISIVTDTPVYFVGLGKADAKPTKGYEVAVVQLTMDASGNGEGTMAAAARVKPGGETGVQIDDYAETPIKLTATSTLKK